MNISKLFLSLKYRGFIYTFSILLSLTIRKIGFSKILQKALNKVNSTLSLGYVQDRINPRSFNEKINFLKYNSNQIFLSKFADKLRNREILQNQGYDGILNEIYFYTVNVDEINFDLLPDSFVMKSNHGSGMIKIVKNKSKISHSDLIELASKWINTKYNEKNGGAEFHYDYIQPVIIFEKILANENNSPLLDYKFYCFSGVVEFIDVIDNSFGIPIMYVFDKDWNQLSFSLYNKQIKSSFGKPNMLKEMIDIAQTLSKNFPFVRIDLYLIDDLKIIFGEYTFFPGGGVLKFCPQKFDFYYGTKINLKKNENFY